MSNLRVSSIEPRARHNAALAFAIVILGWAALASAQEVPVTLRAAILVRALSYEKTFSSGKGPAKILVVGSENGASDAAAFAATLTQLGQAGDRKLVVVTQNRDVTEESVRGSRAEVVYVGSGNEASLPAARRAAKLVLCGDPSHVGKGCVLSVEAAGRSSRLVIDLGEAQRKGLRFDARMLQLARVIR